MKLGVYRALFGHLVEPRLRAEIDTRGQVHGSVLRDWLIENGVNVDDHADRLLEELVRDGVLRRSRFAQPTTSQAAFLGLQHKRHPGWVPGCREHFWYFDAVIRPDAVGWEGMS